MSLNILLEFQYLNRLGLFLSIKHCLSETLCVFYGDSYTKCASTNIVISQFLYKWVDKMILICSGWVHCFIFSPFGAWMASFSCWKCPDSDRHVIYKCGAWQDGGMLTNWFITHYLMHSSYTWFIIINRKLHFRIKKGRCCIYVWFYEDT